jgi:hypothetical protein
MATTGVKCIKDHKSAKDTDNLTEFSYFWDRMKAFREHIGEIDPWCLEEQCPSFLCFSNGVSRHNFVSSIGL